MRWGASVVSWHSRVRARAEAEQGRTYWAFLSYSHSDTGWTAWLHRNLERYAIPRRLVGRPTPFGPVPKHLRPIFRDRDELTAASDLGVRLRGALQHSRFLIVICSPRSAQSFWVEQEIRAFKSVHGEDGILGVIVDGEPYASNNPETAEQECFPKALRFRLGSDGELSDEPTEPIAADLRQGRDGRRLGLLKVVSGVLGVNLDDLVQRDARRRQVQLASIATVASIAAAAFAVVATFALIARQDALEERAQAEGLVEFMIGDLRKRLAPAGRLDELDAVGARALGYYKAQRPRRMDASSLGRRARVLHMLGEIRDHRGDLAGASAQFEQAARGTEELLRRAPDDPERIYNHGQSMFWIGFVAWRRAQDDIARERFAEYLRLSNRLTEIDPKNEDWLAEVEYANSSLGTVLLENGDINASITGFRRALELAQRLAKTEPDDRYRQMDLGQSYAWLAEAQALKGQLDTALALRRSEDAVYRRLIAKDPDDVRAQHALAVTQVAKARIDLAAGRLPEAMKSATRGQQLLSQLMAKDPEDTSHARDAVTSELMLGQTLLQDGQYEKASVMALAGWTRTRALLAQDPTLQTWAAQRTGSARVQYLKSQAGSAATLADCAARLAQAPAEAANLATLSAARPHNLHLARDGAEAAVLAGDHESLRGRAAVARAWWERGQNILQLARANRLPATDRAETIRRQLMARLATGHPPLQGEGATARIDYRW